MKYQGVYFEQGAIVGQSGTLILGFLFAFHVYVLLSGVFKKIKIKSPVDGI